MYKNRVLLIGIFRHFVRKGEVPQKRNKKMIWLTDDKKTDRQVFDHLTPVYQFLQP